MASSFNLSWAPADDVVGLNHFDNSFQCSKARDHGNARHKYLSSLQQLKNCDH